MSKQTSAYGFAAMNGNDCATTIRMAQKVVASFGPYYVKPELAKGAFHMGVNIIYYSFTHYLAETRKYRK